MYGVCVHGCMCDVYGYMGVCVCMCMDASVYGRRGTWVFLWVKWVYGLGRMCVCAYGCMGA